LPKGAVVPMVSWMSSNVVEISPPKLMTPAFVVISSGVPTPSSLSDLGYQQEKVKKQ